MSSKQGEVGSWVKIKELRTNIPVISFKYYPLTKLKVKDRNRITVRRRENRLETR